MGNFLTRSLSAVARLPILPAAVRGSYALALKRAWRFLPSPIIAEVDGAGRMWVDPWDFIDARLFFFRTWEPSMSGFVRRWLQPGAVAIDIGANIGYYSLLMSRAVGSGGKVYAIEPSAHIREKLKRNVALNGVSNVAVVPFGISDRAERRAFTLSTSNLGASHFGDVADDGLELRRLSDVIAPEDLAKVTLVKVDVEGMEAQVLGDLVALLPRLAPNVAITVELRSSPAINDLLARFGDAGFAPFLLENVYNMYHYAAGKIAPPQPIARLPDGQHDIALVPASRRSDI